MIHKKMSTDFTGKLLIFGEYSIIAGSRALVSPLSLFSGRLLIPEAEDGATPADGHSNYQLGEFMEYLEGQMQKERKGLRMEINRMREDIEAGLVFRSSIPIQYGVGSSAALVASVYHAYGNRDIDRGTENSLELVSLRQRFTRMESYFHGTSSGIDPLCSYTGKTLLVDQGSIRPVSTPAMGGESSLFLLDTGIKGNTGSLVRSYKARLETETGFRERLLNELIPLVDHGIDCFCGYPGCDLKKTFRDISRWQRKHFRQMIPQEVQVLWNEGIVSGKYYLKLCGSGGGGFFLGYTDHLNETLSMLGTSGMPVRAIDLWN
jgi:mevalonate kinase